MHSSQYFATAVTGEVINCEVSVIEDAVDMKKVTKQLEKPVVTGSKAIYLLFCKIYKALVEMGHRVVLDSTCTQGNVTGLVFFLIIYYS